jgi:hypothetical protein
MDPACSYSIHAGAALEALGSWTPFQGACLAESLFMKAVRIHEFGSMVKVLQYEVPIQAPGLDEALIKIEAASLTGRIWLCARAPIA